MKRCPNKLCGEPTEFGGFCPSCKYMGRYGMLLGGVIVGAIAAILKLLK